MEYAAVPTLGVRVRLESAAPVPIRSVLLDTQIQIAARLRSYGAAEQERLLDLFGTPERWRDTLRTLPWTRLTVVVPSFNGSTVVELPVSVWRETMDRHFPGSAWLRLSRDCYDRLRAYRARNAFANWDEAMAALLGDD